MRKTKAAFKAVRESCGLSQQDVADEAGVRILSVKRWENPDHPSQPPDDVWAFLLAARGAMHEDAREAAREIAESYKAADGAGDVAIDYYRNQEQLDEVQLSGGVDEPVGYCNARARLIGNLLDKAEVPYTFEYPE